MDKLGSSFRDVVEWEGEDELFAGVDTALLGLAADSPEPARIAVEERRTEYRTAMAEAWGALDIVAPWEAVPALGRASGALAGVMALGFREERGAFFASDGTRITFGC